MEVGVTKKNKYVGPWIKGGEADIPGSGALIQGRELPGAWINPFLPGIIHMEVAIYIFRLLGERYDLSLFLQT